jgi:hypothetical protein
VPLDTLLLLIFTCGKYYGKLLNKKKVIINMYSQKYILCQ